ncbi:DUF6843 domain-containing protein [Flavobacterium sp. W1B]|uniref:DUF6843 domain-containing protein n=1 Tax=Flavobacterium sp. W1B TaxID=3394146 RepID=UPI0039BC5E8E
MKETFLIPSGFEGRINVVFNQQNANPIIVENDRRIYKIPSDGILITSSKLETGVLDQEYYYLDNNGNKEKIDLTELNKEAGLKASVVKYGTVGIYGNSSEQNPLEFLESIIASKTTIDSIYEYKNEMDFQNKIMKKTNRKF